MRLARPVQASGCRYCTLFRETSYAARNCIEISWQPAPSSQFQTTIIVTLKFDGVALAVVELRLARADLAANFLPLLQSDIRVHEPGDVGTEFSWRYNERCTFASPERF